MLNLVEVVKNTRGANSREVKFMAIGKYVTETVSRRKKTVLDENGNPKLDEDGNEIKVALADDEEIKEEVTSFVSDGVLTDLADAYVLVEGNEQLLRDCFAEGWNERQYSKAANQDELDDFIKDMNFDDDQKTAFKRAARSLNKNPQIQMDLLEAAEVVKNQMLKRKKQMEEAGKAA